jgi:hypothetical protein
MGTPWKLLAVGVLAAGQAWAGGEAKIQDPPGAVGVDQPAGVSLEDRHSERDETDTLRGGATDVIEGKRAGRRGGGALVRPSQTHATIQQGSDARASFGGTGSSAGGADQAATEATQDAGASDATRSTFLGTDIGYGTGTESPPSGSSR